MAITLAGAEGMLRIPPHYIAKMSKSPSPQHLRQGNAPDQFARFGRASSQTPLGERSFGFMTPDLLSLFAAHRTSYCQV